MREGKEEGREEERREEGGKEMTVSGMKQPHSLQKSRYFIAHTSPLSPGLIGLVVKYTSHSTYTYTIILYAAREQLLHRSCACHSYF